MDAGDMLTSWAICIQAVTLKPGQKEQAAVHWMASRQAILFVIGEILTLFLLQQLTVKMLRLQIVTGLNTLILGGLADA